MDRTVTPEGIKVEVGQRWRDLDKRMTGRIVTITQVGAKGYAHYKGAKKGRLSIKRMRPVVGGWELADAKEVA